ncbi:hypothetical protein QAD02_023292 [Eretmocerus hayati]|uniref:Uncharacterized protein n=1 Tax=Eretmocerus hayati TaxID=131215 RepID=A0ACC2PWK0_9HYME|nr:hypothetical protein QAD02_023292 [Eretmocerus hayati]
MAKNNVRLVSLHVAVGDGFYIIYAMGFYGATKTWLLSWHSMAHANTPKQQLMRPAKAAHLGSHRFISPHARMVVDEHGKKDRDREKENGLPWLADGVCEWGKGRDTTSEKDRDKKALLLMIG